MSTPPLCDYGIIFSSTPHLQTEMEPARQKKPTKDVRDSRDCKDIKDVKEDADTGFLLSLSSLESLLSLFGSFCRAGSEMIGIRIDFPLV
jgi:hypothetical protein